MVPKKKIKQLIQQREHFTNKFGIIAAAAGSAIGLGNIWRFPYIVGENGGGAFFLIYLIAIFIIGIPVMLSEFVIGRGGERNAIGSFKQLAPRSLWYLIGVMGVVAAFVILSFYSTVGGWTLEYFYQSLINGFQGNSAAELDAFFTRFSENTLRPVFWQVAFMILTAVIVVSGVTHGIEWYTKILMPLLLVLIIVLDIRAITLSENNEGLKFLFRPDFTKLNSGVILSAVGQAFFSLSLGMGALITYGSYINKTDNLTTTAVEVSLSNTFISLLAGIAIFPAVFAFNMEPSSGVGLVFMTIPNIFMQIPGGYIFSVMFFILLSIAALTSSISVLEVVVACFSEELNLGRRKATLLATIVITIVGIFCTISLGLVPQLNIGGMSLFSFMEYAASNYLLPLGGLLISIFIGWRYGKNPTKQEVTNYGKYHGGYLFSVFLILVRYVAPIGIFLVFLNKLNIF